MKLREKVSIITGGGRGIGRAIVLEFIKQGSNVVICDIDQTLLDEVHQEAIRLEGEILPMNVDIRVESEVEAMVEQAINTFGKVDILVNNAGIQGPLCSIIELRKEDWDNVLSVNLTGMFLCCKAVLRHMIERKTGNIVNVSSPRTWRRLTSTRLQYRVSKYGVDGLTFVLAHQMKNYGICINAMAPPATDTPMSSHLTPEERKKMRKPEEVSQLATFLASQSVDTMNGHFIDFKEWEKDKLKNNHKLMIS